MYERELQPRPMDARSGTFREYSWSCTSVFSLLLINLLHNNRTKIAVWYYTRSKIQHFVFLWVSGAAWIKISVKFIHQTLVHKPQVSKSVRMKNCDIGPKVFANHNLATFLKCSWIVEKHQMLSRLTTWWRWRINWISYCHCSSLESTQWHKG